MNIYIDDIMRVSPSNLTEGAWYGEPQSANPRNRLVDEVLNLLQPPRVTGGTDQAWKRTAETAALPPLETAGFPYEQLPGLARAYAELCQYSIRGAVSYVHRRRFREHLDALVELGVPNGNRIVSRLQSLLEMASEDEPENPAPINIDSLGSMVEFLSRACIQRNPDISLSPDGLVFIEWYDSPGQALSLLFLPDGTARLLWTRRSEEAIPRREKVSATKSIAPLVLFLRHNNALSPGS